MSQINIENLKKKIERNWPKEDVVNFDNNFNFDDLYNFFVLKNDYRTAIYINQLASIWFSTKNPPPAYSAINFSEQLSIIARVNTIIQRGRDETGTPNIDLINFDNINGPYGAIDTNNDLYKLLQINKENKKVRKDDLESRHKELVKEYEQIAQIKETEISNLIALNTWADYYLLRIWELEIEVFGETRTKEHRKITENDKDFFELQSKKKKLSLGRVFWSAVVITALFSIIFSLISKFNYISFGDLKLDDVQKHIPWLIILGLLFYSIRTISLDRRVKLNLLENYKQRFTNASSIEQIIIGNNRLNETQRLELLVQSTKTLFELQPTGYFAGKEDGPSVSDNLINITKR